MKKLHAYLVSLILVFFLSCNSEESNNGNGNQNKSITGAKEWFNDFKSNVPFYKRFNDLGFQWGKAEEVNLPDGSRAIVVPTFLKNVSETYEGSTFLYLYVLEKNKYDPVLFEMIPDSSNLEEKTNIIDLDTFNGYILKWDLVDGFVKGNKFSSGEEGRSVVDTDNPKYAKSLYAKRDAIELNEVIVDKKSPAPGPGNPVGIPTGSTVVIGGGPASNYVSYYGGGGGPSTASNRAYAATMIAKKINGDKLDPCVKAILEKLKTLTQNDIASIMRKLGGDSEIYVLTIELGEVANNDIAGTKWTSLNCYTTVLDNDFMYGLNGTNKNTPPTDLAIAAVMIHEMVHAYFFSVFDDGVNSGMPKELNSYDILYQKYVTKTYIESGQDNAQHAQIWKSFINIMASSLQEYATGVPTNTPSQFYQDIMMGTLMTTGNFESMYPKGTTEYNRIKNNFFTEKNNENNDPNYKPKGKPCK